MNPLTPDMLRAANEATLEQWQGYLDLPVPLSIELGRARLTMRQILELEADSLLQLPRSTGEGVDILAGRAQLARGEIVTIEDRTSIRVNELVTRKP